MSYRTDIADAIKTQLSGQTDVADSSIFTSLDRSLDPSEMPAIVIYTMTSRRGADSAGSTIIPRVVSVVIEAAITSSPASAQADAEDLADAIESAMNADRSLGNTVKECEWQETLTDVVGEGETTLGVVMLQYQVEIDTNLATDSVYEFLAEGMEDAPAPTKVFISGDPVDDAYQPDLTDDIAAIIAAPMAETESACEDGSCQPSAWTGDPPFNLADGTFDNTFDETFG